MKKLILKTALLMATSLSVPMAAHAITTSYDLALDFSTATNSGAWTYGYWDGSAFQQFTTSLNCAGGNCGAAQYNDLRGWNGKVSDPNSPPAIDPNIIKNTGATFTTSGTEPITFNQDKVTFGPYHGPTSARWTAEYAGTFDISATFLTVQTGNTPATAYLYSSLGSFGTPSHQLNASDPWTFDETFTFEAGDYVSFVVWGNDEHNATTQVDALITAVPEPETYALMLAGLGVVGFMARRRKTQ